MLVIRFLTRGSNSLWEFTTKLERFLHAETFGSFGNFAMERFRANMFDAGLDVGIFTAETVDWMRKVA